MFAVPRATYGALDLSGEDMRMLDDPGTERSGAARALSRCRTCGHTEFVHADFNERRCLYSECGCETGFEPSEGGSPERGAPTTLWVGLVATKSGSTVRALLPRPEARQRAKDLARDGWDVGMIDGPLSRVFDPAR